LNFLYGWSHRPFDLSLALSLWITWNLTACFRSISLGFVNSVVLLTTLTKIMDDIHLGVERTGFLISVLVDFSTVFDSMSHDLLLHKLRFELGLSSTACQLVDFWVLGLRRL
jgi:hypothetical protein